MRRRKAGQEPGESDETEAPSQTADQNPRPTRAAVNPNRTPSPMVDAQGLANEIAAMDPAELDKLLLSNDQRREPRHGARVSGKVVRVDREELVIDIGAKGDAVADRADWSEVPPVGATVTGTILRGPEGEWRFVQKLGGGGRATPAEIQNAYEAKLPIEGKVEARNTGGFTVRLGGLTAFCPVSQIDTRGSEDLDRFVGQTLMFQVVEIRGGDVVVGRRDIAERESRERAGKRWETFTPGQHLEGVVTSVRDFGVFVDVGDVQGLVHKSEISWDDAAKMPAAGDHVSVSVIEVKVTERRLSLSMKSESMDPWSRVGEELGVGAVIEGTVMRIEPYGVFVRIASNVEGLAHISTLSTRRINHPSEITKVGDKLKVRILGIDLAKRRLSLGVRQADEADWEAESAPMPPQPTTPQSFGTFGDLLSNLKLPSR